MSLPDTTKGSGAAPPLTTGVELSKPQRRILATLGHRIARFAAACDRLGAAQKSFPGLSPWFQTDAMRQSCTLAGNGIFACPVICDGSRMMLDPLVASAEACSDALRGFPSAEVGQADVLEIPPVLNLPVWLALLRLRPLRDFWERALRRSRMAKFLGLLPDAWLLDPTPLPPGGVIPRLEIAAWSDLDMAARDFSPATPEEIAQRLSAFPDPPGILKSRPPVSPNAIPLVSFYLQHHGRVAWLGVLVRR